MTKRVDDVTTLFLALAGQRPVHRDNELEGLRKARIALDTVPGVTLDEITEAFDRIAAFAAAAERRQQVLAERKAALQACVVAMPEAVAEVDAQIIAELLRPIAPGGPTPFAIANRGEALDGG